MTAQGAQPTGRPDSPARRQPSAGSHQSSAGSHSHSGRLGITLALTGTVLLLEVLGAVLTGSLALLVDAGHMLTDVSVLVASLITARLMRRKPTKSLTWGWDRLEVITAAGAAIVLLVAGVYALVAAVQRLFFAPDPVDKVPLMLAFGIVGLVANLASLLTLRSQRDANLNLRAAFLEVLGDALGSLGVVIGAFLLLTTGWTAADSVIGALIALLMIPRAVSLLSRSVRVLLMEVPSELDLEQVRQHLQAVPGVETVHDLHVSTVRTGLVMLIAHVVVHDGLSQAQESEVLAALQSCVRQHFPLPVEHATFQIEAHSYAESHAEAVHS